MNLSLPNRIHGDAKRVGHRGGAPSPASSVEVVEVGSAQTGDSSDRPPASSQAAGETPERNAGEERGTRSVVQSARRAVVMLESAKADSVHLVEGFRRMRELADRVTDPGLSAQERELVEVEYLELKGEMARVVSEADAAPVLHEAPEMSTLLRDADLSVQAQATPEATLRLLS
jgi:hypothetical protein